MPRGVDASFTLRSSLIYSRNYKIDSTRRDLLWRHLFLTRHISLNLPLSVKAMAWDLARFDLTEHTHQRMLCVYMCLSGKESDRERECVTVLVVFLKKTVGTYCFKRKLLGPCYPQVSRLLLVFAWDSSKLRIHRKQVDNSIGSVICSKLSEDPHTFLVSCSFCCRCISLSTSTSVRSIIMDRIRRV